MSQIKLGKKVIFMFLKVNLLVKLPEERISEIIAAGDGEPYDPGTGKPMKNWVLITETRRELWIKYSEEAKQY